jgi:GT2 family glycosyltransferase
MLVNLTTENGQIARAGTVSERNGVHRDVQERFRLDGKFLRRGMKRFRVQGVTYGPFAPGEAGEPFPAREQVRADCSLMRSIGVNALRTYHVPPESFLETTAEEGLAVFVDVPWPKHLCFLEGKRHRAEARELVRQAAERGRNYSHLLAYSIGNEIPANIARWHGPAQVQRFLHELFDVAKQADPERLVTYASFPPTEYLDLSFLDFVTFNVYLHDPETFRRYLFRLQNLVGDKPLLLGELGMDTLRMGELEQSRFLQGHMRELILMGLAGAFVFSWTDEWHAVGGPVTNWAFGITDAERSPRASYHALREVFECTSPELLEARPRVSVVVCSYNGGRTLDQCVRSLLALDYPDYEVIVVDDGSTDDTRAILERYPAVRAIHQPNRGLSTARNAGLRAATGSIIAYTDSDCFADPDWLSHLVYQFERTNAAAVGGPNLSPEDGRVAACVAAAPGQPTHVLESDQVAEHIPGCNMAFRREALEAINGFDPQYRKAGDDVDLCWRLQQAGHWIAFAPGAFVWHHRRHTPRAYLRQQSGYGEAEALLRFKHPDKFNQRGSGRWRGVLYGASSKGLQLDGAIIYRGTFGTAWFQCLYQPSPAHWAMAPATLEWQVATLAVAVAAVFWPILWIGVGAMLGLSLTVAGLQAAQAELAPAHRGWRSRLLVMGLCYLGPLVRSWSRYRTRFFSYSPPTAPGHVVPDATHRLPLSGRKSVAYWSEQGYERTELLGVVIAYLNEHGWGRTLDSGWKDWDLEVHCHPWTVVRVCTAQEEHGGGKRLLRIRYRLRPSGYSKALAVFAAVAAGTACLLEAWVAVGLSGFILAAVAGSWWRGTRRAGQVVGLFDAEARKWGLVRCDGENALTIDN